MNKKCKNISADRLKHVSSSRFVPLELTDVELWSTVLIEVCAEGMAIVAEMGWQKDWQLSKRSCCAEHALQLVCMGECAEMYEWKGFLTIAGLRPMHGGCPNFVTSVEHLTTLRESNFRRTCHRNPIRKITLQMQLQKSRTLAD